MKKLLGIVFLLTLGLLPAFAGEADINLPDLSLVKFGSVSGLHLMYAGLVVCVIGLVFGLIQYKQTKAMPVHESHGERLADDLGNLQDLPVPAGQVPGRPVGADRRVHGLLLRAALQHKSRHRRRRSSCSARSSASSAPTAWPGSASASTRRPTRRSAFAALRGTPWLALAIPMKSGMSVGLLLVSVELFFMICILTLPADGARRPLLHRLRHRRVAGRERAAYLRRHLHEDRRHRLRPDEDRLQAAGRRPEEPRRHRRLHRRQRRRQRRARRPTASRPTA